MVLNLLGDDFEYLNNSRIDLSDSNFSPSDYTFEFNSIHESYKWLNNKLDAYKLPKDKGGSKETQKLVEVVKDNIHDDSDNEIRYLSNRIRRIKSGAKKDEIFVPSRSEYKKLKNNYFFKQLKKNISKTYRLFYIEREDIKKLSKRLDKLVGWGYIIFHDCVYMDYENNSRTLGYVDLKKKTRKEYMVAFDKLLSMSRRITKG
jgi:hypothetical protein